MSDYRCLHCGVSMAQPTDQQPAPMLIDDDGNESPDGRPAQWCSSACTDAWMAANPRRAEGWINVADMSPEWLNAEFQKVGLCLDGVGERTPS